VPPSELKFETLEPVDSATLHHPSRGSLSEIFSTAIAGNDFSSSVLYAFFFFALVTGPRGSLSLKLSDTGVVRASNTSSPRYNSTP